MVLVSLVLFSLSFLIHEALSAGDPAGIAAQLGLTTSTVLPFPSETMAAGGDTTGYMKENWALQGGISFGEKSLAFVNDPIGGSNSNSDSEVKKVMKRASTSSNDTSNSGSIVFSVTYDAGTYSHGTGGAQFYSTFGGEAGFEAMLVSYDIAFDSDFDWVKGGKLAGIRGGPKLDSCSGGHQPTGSDCFSSRLMWRKDGDGEVYAYLPQQQSLCDVEGITCNSDYGFSLGRGKFKYTAGQWQTVAVYSKMNNSPTKSNGEIALYFNGEQVFSFNNLKFWTSDVVKAGGMYFSTFFGGSDQSWATPKTVHTYYRNFQMFGGAGTNSGGSSNSTSTSGPSSDGASSEPSSSSKETGTKSTSGSYNDT
ncbi:hypothetical protein ACEPAG_8585 [Sanghuangporus baumii]